MKMMSRIMLTCKKASEYIERDRDLNLNLIQRLQLRMHLIFCSLCRSYSHQSDQIHSFILQFKKSETSTMPDVEKVKTNILQKAQKTKD